MNKAMAILLMVCIPSLFMAGCVTTEWKIAKYEELKVEWQKEHPGEVMTPAVEAYLFEEATKLAEEEAAAAKAAAFKQAGDVGASFATGNIIGGILGLLGLGSIAVGATMKMKGKA